MFRQCYIRILNESAIDENHVIYFSVCCSMHTVIIPWYPLVDKSYKMNYSYYYIPPILVHLHHVQQQTKRTICTRFEQATENCQDFWSSDPCSHKHQLTTTTTLPMTTLKWWTQTTTAPQSSLQLITPPLPQIMPIRVPQRTERKIQRRKQQMMQQWSRAIFCPP